MNIYSEYYTLPISSGSPLSVHPVLKEIRDHYGFPPGPNSESVQIVVRYVTGVSLPPPGVKPPLSRKPSRITKITKNVASHNPMEHDIISNLLPPVLPLVNVDFYIRDIKTWIKAADVWICALSHGSIMTVEALVSPHGFSGRIRSDHLIAPVARVWFAAHGEDSTPNGVPQFHASEFEATLFGAEYAARWLFTVIQPTLLPPGGLPYVEIEPQDVFPLGFTFDITKSAAPPIPFGFREFRSPGDHPIDVSRLLQTPARPVPVLPPVEGSANFFQKFMAAVAHPTPPSWFKTPPENSFLMGVIQGVFWYTKSEAPPPPSGRRGASRYARLHVPEVPLDSQPEMPELPSEVVGARVPFRVSRYNPGPRTREMLEQIRRLSPTEFGNKSFPVINLLNKKLFIYRTPTKLILLARVIPAPHEMEIFPDMWDSGLYHRYSPSYQEKSAIASHAHGLSQALYLQTPNLRMMDLGDPIPYVNFSALVKFPCFAQAAGEVEISGPYNLSQHFPLIRSLLEGRAVFHSSTLYGVTCSCGNAKGRPVDHHGHEVTAFDVSPLSPPFPIYGEADLAHSYLSVVVLEGLRISLGKTSIKHGANEIDGIWGSSKQRWMGSLFYNRGSVPPYGF